MYKYKINQSVVLPEKEVKEGMLVKRKEKRKMAGWRGIGYRHTLWFPYKYFSVIHTWIVRYVVHGGYCRLFLGSVCGVCVCMLQCVAHNSRQPLRFLRLRTCSAALVAISNTSRTPSLVLAEHSKYPNALILLAMSRPSSGFTGSWNIHIYDERQHSFRKYLN